jgi:hypothetical protein
MKRKRQYFYHGRKLKCHYSSPKDVKERLTLL